MQKNSVDKSEIAARFVVVIIIFIVLGVFVLFLKPDIFKTGKVCLNSVFTIRKNLIDGRFRLGMTPDEAKKKIQTEIFPKGPNVYSHATVYTIRFYDYFYGILSWVDLSFKNNELTCISAKLEHRKYSTMELCKKLTLAANSLKSKYGPPTQQRGVFSPGKVAQLMNWKLADGTEILYEFSDIFRFWRIIWWAGEPEQGKLTKETNKNGTQTEMLGPPPDIFKAFMDLDPDTLKALSDLGDKDE